MRLQSNFKKIVHLIFTILCLTRSFQSTGQDIDEEFWSDYNLSAQIDDNWFIVGDVGFRGFIFNKDWNQLYIRPGVRYRINKTVNVQGSFASFNTLNIYNKNLYEFRITADVNVRWPVFGWFNISNRGRIENRSFFSEGGLNENNFRGRVLVSINSKSFHVFSEKRAINFQAQIEPFFLLGKDSFGEIFSNQLRLYGIFEHSISEAFGYDIQYIWQQSRISVEESFVIKQHIIRIRVYHRILRK